MKQTGRSDPSIQGLSRRQQPTSKTPFNTVFYSVIFKTARYRTVILGLSIGTDSLLYCTHSLSLFRRPQARLMLFCVIPAVAEVGQTRKRLRDLKNMSCNFSCESHLNQSTHQLTSLLLFIQAPYESLLTSSGNIYRFLSATSTYELKSSSSHRQSVLLKQGRSFPKVFFFRFIYVH